MTLTKEEIELILLALDKLTSEDLPNGDLLFDLHEKLEAEQFTKDK